MCSTCPSGPLTLHVQRRQGRYDPTRTLTIRRRFEAEMNKRFRAIRGAVKKAIVDQDVFGLRQPQANVSLPGGKAFDFPRSADKIAAFMRWLNRSVEAELLEISTTRQMGTAIEPHWTDMYVEDSYKRGVQRAVTEMRKAGYPVQSIAQQGGLQAIMSTPVHVDRLGVLFTRVFSDLKGITSAMDTTISRALAQGIADGDNPRLLARKINATIDRLSGGARDLGLTDTLGRFIPAQRRALTLARTEIIRAHHQGMVQEYRNWEVAGLTVQAEFQTAGDNRVCSLCEGLQGNVYTLDEIQNLIPVHPNCRCVALPVPYNPTATPTTTAPDEGSTEDVDEVVGTLQPEYRQRYTELKAQHNVFFDNLTDEEKALLVAGVPPDENMPRPLRTRISEYIQSNPELYRAGFTLDDWQGTTAAYGPMTLKYRQMQVQGGNRSEFMFPSSWDGLNVKNPFQSFEVAEADKKITVEGYLSLRAFNQSYMERLGVESVTMYRGIGGEAGESIRANLRREGMRRTKFTIPEATISGFSTDKQIADKFGRSMGGVSFSMTVPRHQIVVHENLLSAYSGAFRREREYLVVGGKRNINVNQIDY